MTPYNCEERLKVYKEIPLRRLKLKVPEVADLILMKVIRAVEHDLETIKELIQKHHVPTQMLVERFKTEMDHVVAEPRKLKMNFLVMIEENYPQLDLEGIKQRIGFTKI